MSILNINSKADCYVSMCFELNKSANLASCRDSPSYLASAEIFRDPLLPVEIVVHEKWLPGESVRVFLHPAETLYRKYDHAFSAGNHFPRRADSTESKKTRTV